MKKIAVILLSMLIAACASASKTATTSPPANAAPAETATTAPVSTADVDAKKLADEVQALQQQSVYFDFDKSDIAAQYQDVIMKQAQFIKEHGNDVVTVEGNADERGSKEYNLALGNRRAEAVEKSLEILGIQAKQIRVISLGEEKPRQTCHEEKCWKENRRADFVHDLSS